MKIEKIWEFNTNEQILGVELGTLNTSNNKQIIAYTKSGKILIISLMGKLLLKDGITQNTPIWKAVIYDIDNDGKEELLLGGLDGLLRVFKLKGDFKLEAYWTHRFGSSISGILVDDINNDGIKEIISYSLDKSLRILNSMDGSLIWGQIFEDGIEAATIWTDTSDIYKKEVFACGNDGTLRLFNGKDGDLIWFKRYSDKVRCVAYLKSKKGDFIICGGDDKKAHIINKRNHKEIKTIQFDNYVWKTLSFPCNVNNNLLISSYSFAHFDESSTINVEFNSKLIYIDENLDIKWELKNKNIESINPINMNDENYIILGTTKGELLILDKNKGKILNFIQKESTINDIKYESSSNLIFTCHNNGNLFAYSIKDFELR